MDKERTRAFVSYSHADADVAQRFVDSLDAKVEGVWWDRWDLEPGDSIIRKVFESGLKGASHFIILLSRESVRSSWVREELDAATVNKINGLTRIIPAVIDDTEIPVSLRAILWVDLRSDFEAGVQRIANVINGVSTRPSTPSTAPSLPQSVGGLSSAATMVGDYVLRARDHSTGLQASVEQHELRRELALDPDALNDAVDELREHGLVRVMRALGTSFVQVEPTYVLFREFCNHLDYDPDDDVHRVAAAVASSDRDCRGSELAKETGLSPGRVSRAVEYLDDSGLATVHRVIGTRPFTFGSVTPTFRTRQYVDRD
ncbi:toll/interleukin-1 receptor domain-containing protein [Synechococcus sp. PCC 7336]|uniref:toll/interleukin-1 receptor domain-containing protein n=1 Tax=Synechococcus sp. PCC 7336 TaxID=195250 RepID=UPI0003605A5A|nr:toll/interleukin-1 receptor domain-containing protein [Synechococcus sp. PCC 7336]